MQKRKGQQAGTGRGAQNNEKAALALREATRLSDETSAFAKVVEASLAEFLLGIRPPPAPPLAAPSGQLLPR